MASSGDLVSTPALVGLPRILSVIHYAYPTSVFSYFILALLVTVCTLQSRAAASKNARQHPRRHSITLLLCALVVSFGLQVLALLVDAIVRHEWVHPQDTTLSYLSCILVFGTELGLLTGTEHPVWYPYYGSWMLAAIFEPIVFTLGKQIDASSSWAAVDIVTAVIWSVRYLILVVALVSYFASKDSVSKDVEDENEQQPLLPKNTDQASANGTSYGGTTQSNGNNNTNELPWERSDRKARESMQKKLENDGNWFTYVKRFKVFLPYIWPVNHLGLQLRALLVALCLLGGNALNVLIPRQMGAVMDCLSGVRPGNPWVQVAVFTALRWLNSEAGLSLLRTWLWMPVEYYSIEQIDTAAYSHILSLSCDFHDSKSASDLIQAISKGESISEMLESVCFHAIPMLIDLGIAFIYLSYTFGPYEGFITLATAIAFLYSTSRLVGGLRESRRKQVNAVYEEHFVRLTGIQGWHTVSQFNQINYEENRHSNAVKKKVSNYKSFAFRYYISRAVQYMVLLTGLLAGSFLAVYQVLNNQATAGQFVMLLTYWGQLSSPLDFFAGLWKKLAQNLVNAERLLEIMETRPSVLSKEGAPKLELRGGNVSFRNVCFTYDKKKNILKDVSFEVPTGQTVAFVGATGAGKSTILKLLNRFYDVTGGSVEIDGQDVRDVELSSLRAHLGVVPQAPILFNDTIMNNIRYARLTASDEEVSKACEAACIHDQIMGFSDGYSTVVGERGVKLSGGELQRVAIARAILKQPEIVLLDEATSAVDTETEQKIQDALKTLCNGRTTFVVAHRLSTVMNADRIIVVGDGKIVEQGTHEQLIQAQGKYASLWSKQIFVKPKNDDDGCDSGETTEADVQGELGPGEDKKDGNASGDSDTSSSPTSRGDKSNPWKKGGWSKLDSDTPEFTSINTGTLSCASTEQGETSPVESDGATGLRAHGGKEKATNQNREAKTENISKSANMNGTAHVDRAADDEQESGDEESRCRMVSSLEIAKYPRYKRSVHPTSESAAESSNDPEECSTSPLRRVSAPPANERAPLLTTDNSSERD